MGNDIAGKKINHQINKQKFVEYYNQYGIFTIFAIFVIIASIMTPKFLTPSNILNVLRQVSINGIITIGMTFVIIGGGIDLSVGTTVGATGMVLMILMPKIGLWPAILCAFGLAAIIGSINGISINKGMPPFIMTLAMQLATRGFSYVISDGQPYPATDETFKFIGQGFIGPIPVPIIVFALLVILAHFILVKTTFGRSVYAMGGNREAARLSGINLAVTEAGVYTISAVLSAVAAIVLTSRLYSCDPTIGTGYEGDAIAATVIGGTSMSGGQGNVLKALIGVLIIGVISNILNLMHVSSYVQIITKGVIIFVAVAIDTWRKR